MKNRVIAVANQKGGVGKTTTCVNLAASLGATKHRTLLIDLDPQGNATMGSGIDKTQLDQSIKEVLLEDAPLANAILETAFNYEVVPANGELTVAEVKLLGQQQREYKLKQALDGVREQYDFIFIDCPPALNMLTVNAFAAADAVLVPMQCEYFALEGITGLLNTIERMKQAVNHRLQVEGILRTMYDGRNRLAIEVSEQLKEYFGEKVYHTMIPRNVRLAEAPSHGLPVLYYDKHCQGTTAYLALAGEIIRRSVAPQDVDIQRS